MNLSQLSNLQTAKATQEANTQRESKSFDFNLDDAVNEGQKLQPSFKRRNAYGRFNIKYNKPGEDNSKRIIFLNEKFDSKSNVIPVYEHQFWDKSEVKKVENGVEKTSVEDRPYFISCLEKNELINDGCTLACPLCQGGDVAKYCMMFSVLYDDTYEENGQVIEKFRRGILPVMIYSSNSNKAGYWDDFKSKLLNKIEKNNGNLRGIGIRLTRPDKQSPLSGFIANWDEVAEIPTKLFTEQELQEQFGNKEFVNDKGDTIEANANLKTFDPTYFVPNKEIQGQFNGWQKPMNKFAGK